MKRLISLLLIVITLSSLLAGCEWNGEFDWNKIFNWGESEPKWELPEGIIETTVEKDGAQLTIAHSENFTQDDIDFVVMRHQRKINDYLQQYLWKDPYTFGDVLEWVQDGDPLLLVQINNPYIICAYIKPNQPGYIVGDYGDYIFDSTKYVWYKFDHPREMKYRRGDVTLSSHSFLLYNCTIISDVITETEYNKQCVYYFKTNVDDAYERLKKPEQNLLIYPSDKDITSSENKFLKQSGIINSIHDVYTDENGDNYINLGYEMWGRTPELGFFMGYGNVQDRLSEFYDILSPYFKYTDTEYTYNDLPHIERIVDIKIDDLREALLKRE